jgi:hypothetical protein
MRWVVEGGIWKLMDGEMCVGWITKRNCCWYASLNDDLTRSHSFVRLDDAKLYTEQEVVNGRTGRIV